MSLTLISQHTCFNGSQSFYRHASGEIGLDMRFSIYLPPQATHAKVPALFYLAGLTCTEETFMIKAGAQRLAAELGVALICPDTSPRGANITGEDEAWDLGTGAGFYLDATQEPWSKHYRMYSYITKELYSLISENFAIDSNRIGIFGHSMGGHGALSLAIRNPHLFKSVSAFAPIAAPTHCPWGHKAFSTYLGNVQSTWQEYDSSCLMAKAHNPFPKGILIDQGLADNFLTEQLYPEIFEQACEKAQQKLTLRRHEHYDHGYYFISSFIQDHMKFHAQCLSTN